MKYLVFTFLISIGICSGISINAESNITLDLNLTTSRGNVNFEIHGETADLIYLQRVKEILHQQALPILDYFEYKPTTAIHFRINKTATSANGSATVFPRNLITLNTFPPFGNGHLITGEDWLVGLVLHELIHIVHMDQTTGLPATIRTVFGSIAKWGGIVPRWFSEGIAMWGETKFTNGGRLRQKMLLYEFDARFSDTEFCQTIDCLDDPGKYPYGQYPYWIGGTFMNWIESQKEGNIKCLIKENSRNIPFVLNDVFRKCLGKDASAAYREFRFDTVSKIKEKDKSSHPLAEGKQKIRFSTKETPLFQKGWQIVGGKLIYIEDRDQIEFLTIRDLGKNETDHHRFPFHIDQIYPLSDSDNQLIFNTSTYDRYSKKRNTSTFTIDGGETQDQNIQGEYPGILRGQIFVLKNENYSWKVYREDELVYQFPNLVQVNSVNYHTVGSRDFLTAKIIDPFAQSPYQYWMIELGGQDAPSKIHQFWNSDKPFNHLLSCHGRHILRQDSEMILMEMTALDQKVVKKINLNWSRDIVQIKGDKSNTVALLMSRPGFAFVQDKSCDEFIDEIFYESKQDKPDTLHEYQPAPRKVDETQEVGEYPRASHFLPHWWAFSYYAGAQLANWQINTSLNDPRDKHTLNIALKYFPDLSEATPSGTYNYNYGNNNMGVGYDRIYINSSLKISPNLTERKFAYLSRSMNRWGWTFLPRLTHTLKLTKDIFGERNITNTSLNTVFYKEPMFADAFFKNTLLYANAYHEDIENLAAFWANEFKLIETLQPFRRFYLHLQGTYAKLYNDSFLEGVVYSGGYDDYSVSAFHPFYGISVNDAYGREVLSYRAQLDATISDSHKGIGLFPLFIRSLSLIGGYEYLKTDRIYVYSSKRFIRDGDITGAHIGIRARTTIGYFVPVEFDFISNKTFNPVGDDYNTNLFLLKASFFL